MKILRLILGDQLNSKHSWFQRQSSDVIYTMMEIRQETDYIRHHIQKVTGIFASMRYFYKWLTDQGHRLIYLKITDPNNRQNLKQNLKNIITDNSIDWFEYQQPDEYRLDIELKKFCETLSIPHRECSTEHFITSRNDLSKYFPFAKQYVMENFYRKMRREHFILMTDDQPRGNRWNFDRENRNRWNGKPALPPPFDLYNDCRREHQDIITAGIETIGNINPERLIWPLNRNQALKMLENFINFRLPWFGQFQDAMTIQSQEIFHSRLSFALNTKMIDPMEVILRIQTAQENNPEKITLNQAEGFIRQILGWREFMRCIYWRFMPDYAAMNYFNHHRELPRFYWTGETKMNCLHHCIYQSLESAYAHHIQRLMITGNFALLMGVHPDAIDRWYLGIYIDAFQWVEITNTRGMSQYGDGGIVATKPYISSANYIQKMSDYCKDCHYNPKLRTDAKACPFNSLYWKFLDHHYKHLESNQRMKFVLKLWKKKTRDERRSIITHANAVLEDSDNL